MSNKIAEIKISLGDSDNDGHVGVSAELFVNAPFDGTDKLKSMFRSPEVEVPVSELPSVLAKIWGAAKHLVP